MIKALRFGFSATAIVAFGIATSGLAKADLILCPNQALQGGTGGTFTPFNGSQDGTCGAGSGETLQVNPDTNYAKLMWNTSTSPSGASTQPLPSGLTLGNMPDATASVTFDADQSGVSPYFLLSFADPSDSLGQGAAGDQILMIEFQDLGINGAGATTMSLDPNATLFNLFDNTTGTYLAGGQQDANTLTTWLSTYSSLGTDSVDGLWVAEALTGGCQESCGETLSVDSVDLAVSTPEPGTMALMVMGLSALVILHRKAAR